MSHRTGLWSAIPVAIALAAPAIAQDEPALDTVLATVNGEEITLGHMLVIRARLPGEYDNLSAGQLYDGILGQLIDQTVLAQGADTLNDVNALIAQNEERALLASQTIQEVAAEATSEEAIEARYQQDFGGEGEPEFNASHILVETQDEALEVIEELEGGAAFADVARERSTGPSGPGGGSLGWFGMGMMVAPFEAAVVELEPGEISGPVETQFGWHVVTLNDRRIPEAPPLEEVRQEIVNDIQNEAVQGYIEMLRNGPTAAIDINTDLGPDVVNLIDLLSAE